MTGILILQFDGWLIPGLLLLEVPLALMGGAIALVISGVGLNATGLVAFLTLIGIGLRHGIVLLDRVRHNEAAGLAVEEAVRAAIRVRFRPIVLTAVTAALGMLPTALGLGAGAAPEQGLAIVILGGLIWSAVRSEHRFGRILGAHCSKECRGRASPRPKRLQVLWNGSCHHVSHIDERAAGSHWSAHVVRNHDVLSHIP